VLGPIGSDGRMDTETRLSLWRAFSGFFLDTELTDSDFHRIAKVVRAANCTLKEAEAILWNEVYPILEGNLRNVAGVWAGWPDDWLVQHLKPSIGAAVRTGDPTVVGEIQQCWEKTLSFYGSGA